MPNHHATHDVFISYSRSDRTFAKLLERQLESYSPPPGLDLPARRIRAFLDTSDIRGADYDRAIDRELAGARNLVVLCSPAARQSGFVNDEIRRFLALKRDSDARASVVPLLVDGIPNNEAEAPGGEQKKAFPEALYEAARMPLAQDFRGFDVRRNKLNAGAYRDAWFATLATLLNVERHALEERDRRRAVRRRNVAIGVVLSVVTALSLTTAYAIWQQRIAESQRDLAQQQLRVAQAGELAAESRFLSDRKAYLYRPAMLLAIESLRKRASPQGTNALQSGLSLSLLPVRAIPGNETEGVAFGADGRWLAVASPSGEVAFESLVAAVELPPTIGAPGAIKGIALAPDGTMLATAGRDGFARVWDIATGREIFSLPHEGYLDNVAFGSDGRHLVTASQKARRVTLWNFRERTIEFEAELSLGRLDRPGMSAALSPDGRWLAVTGHGRSAFVWDLKDPGEPAVLEHDDWVVANAFTPDGEFLVTAGAGQKARIWRVGEWSLARDIQHDTGFGEGNILDLSISPDGRLLATASTRSQPVGAPAMFGAVGLVRIWDLATGNEVGRVEGDGGASIVSFSTDSRTIAVGGGSNVRLWSAYPGHEMSPFMPPGALASEIGRHFAISRDGSLVAATFARTVLLWDAASGRLVNSLEVEGRYAGALAFAPDGSRLAIAVSEGAVIWDFAAGTSEHLSKSGQQGTSQVSFAEDGDRLAAANIEAFWRWDVETGAIVGAHAFDEEKDHSLALSNGGVQFAISGGRIYMDQGSPSTARIWDVATGELLQTLHYDGVAGTMVFNGNAGRLITGGEGGNVRVWDVGSGSLIARMTHDDSVRGVAVSGNDAWIASASRDGTVKVSDSTSQEEISRFELNDLPVAIRFGPNDRTIWIMTQRGTILRREWRHDELIELACSRLIGNFTAAEWREYMDDGPNRAVCHRLPLDEPIAATLE
jgi:WD40 repeat protein